MDFGRLLAGAGVVGTSMRQTEQAERLARENQLKIEGQNRLNQLRREMLQAPMPQASIPQFDIGTGMPVIQAPPAGGAPVGSVAPAAAPTAPAVAGQSFRQALPGMGVQPITSTPLVDAAQQGRPMSQQERDRLALLRVPTRALDIFQSPAAAGLNLGSRLFTGAANIGGRVVNAVTGEQTLPTDLQPSTYSATPFYDRYVRGPEQAAAARAGRQPLPSGPSTPVPPGGINFPALAAAVEQVESGGRADAVSPKGAVGPMQTMPKTLTDPGFGVTPARDNSTAELRRVGQEYLSAMLQKYNGNLDYALAAYNWGPGNTDKWIAAGADPAKLPQETRDYIPKVKSQLAQSGAPVGAQASAPAPAPTPAPVQIAAASGQTMTDVTAPTTGRQAAVDPSQFYLANPQSIPRDMQLAMQQRDEVARLAGMYQRAGMGAEFMQTRGKLMELDSSMTYLQGMQGLQEFSLANDPRRLAAVWSQYAGVPVGIQPRTDGKFDILVNGQRTKTGLSSAEITDSARSAFDATYRQQKSAASSEYNKESFKAQLKIQENNAAQLAQMIREVAVKRVEGSNAQALEWLKANSSWDIKPTGSGDGTVIIRPPGAPPYLFNASGKTVEIDGVKVQSNAAYPIAGLPSYGGAQVR